MFSSGRAGAVKRAKFAGPTGKSLCSRRVAALFCFVLLYSVAECKLCFAVSSFSIVRRVFLFVFAIVAGLGKKKQSLISRLRPC